MNTNKYKSVVLDRATYDIMSNISEKGEESIAKTVKNLIYAGLGTEAYEANLDCELFEGGTERLKRLREDLEWFRVHAGVFKSDKELRNTRKRYTIDKEESQAIDVVLDVVSDCCV